MDIFGFHGYVNTHEHVISRHSHISATQQEWNHQPATPCHPCVQKAHGCGDLFHRPSWKDNVVGISTDSERKMTNRISCIAMMFQNVAKPGFICVWCGAHQINIFLQGRYYKFGDNAFYQQLTRLISYIQIQKNLISVMRPKAPKVEDTHWESMGKVSNWLKRNKIEIDMHINNKHPYCTTSPILCIHPVVVAEFYCVATTTFKIIQGHHVTVTMQRIRFMCM